MIPALLFVLVSFVYPLDDRLKKADQFYKSGQSSETIALLKEVLADNPSDAEACWRMARVYCDAGDRKTEKADKLATYQTAMGYAEKAKTSSPTLAEAWYWYAVSMGRVGQTKGMLNAMSLAVPVRDAFLKTVELNPRHIGALFGLGMWYKEVPGVAGGDMEKSISYFNKILAVDPIYTEVYVRLGEIYIKRGEYATARTCLEKCLAVTVPTYPAAFASNDKPRAQKLLAQIEGK